MGTQVAEGKEIREFDGKKYVMERALVPDVALVKALVADKSGNLIFNKTARNFNPNAAMAGKITVAEVERIVENGELDPDHIHLPGIYVHRLVLNATPEAQDQGIPPYALRAPSMVSPQPLCGSLPKGACTDLGRPGAGSRGGAGWTGGAGSTASWVDGYQGEMTWHGLEMTWLRGRRVSCRMVSTPTWASGCRRWRPIMCPRGWRSGCSPRTGCWASGRFPPRTRSIPT